MADRDPNRGEHTEGRDRNKYRDNDDVRDPIAPADRMGSKPDTKSEAKGDARESIGNTAHKQYGNPDREGK